MQLTALPAFLGWDYCWHQEWQADEGKPRIIHLNFLLGFLCFKITLHILFQSDLPFHHTPLYHANYSMLIISPWGFMHTSASYLLGESEWFLERQIWPCVSLTKFLWWHSIMVKRTRVQILFMPSQGSPYPSCLSHRTFSSHSVFIVPTLLSSSWFLDILSTLDLLGSCHFLCLHPFFFSQLNPTLLSSRSPIISW